MLKIAILDDYAKVALQSADWSVLRGKAEITVFDRHLTEDKKRHPCSDPSTSFAPCAADEPAAQPVPATA